jgi:hypothetical protein
MFVYIMGATAHRTMLSMQNVTTNVAEAATLATVTKWQHNHPPAALHKIVMVLL